MNPRTTSESSIPSHDAVPSPSHYTGQDNLASQPLTGFLGSVQGSEENVGPPSHPPYYPYTHTHESPHVYGYVPNAPHRQGQSYPQPPSFLGEIPIPPSQTVVHPIYAQWDAMRWNRQIEQERRAAHDPFTPPQWTQRVPGPSAPTEFNLPLPSTKTPDTFPLHVPPYTSPMVQNSHRTGREHHNEPGVDPGTEHPRLESVSHEASTRPSKKRKDMLRKRGQRAEDRQNFAKICELLEIPLNPQNTLTCRILVSVKKLVKQRKLDGALRRRLEAGEIDLAVMRGELVQDSAAGSSDIATHSHSIISRDAGEGYN